MFFKRFDVKKVKDQKVQIRMFPLKINFCIQITPSDRTPVISEMIANHTCAHSHGLHHVDDQVVQNDFIFVCIDVR